MEHESTAGLRRFGAGRRCLAAAWLTCAAACLSGYAAAEPVRMRHTPPPAATAWRPVAVSVELQEEIDRAAVATVDVVVLSGDGTELAVGLSMSRTALLGEIPGAYVHPPTLSYYFRLVDVDGTESLLPSGAPGGGLFSVAVTGGEDALTARPVEILSPLPGEVVPTRGVEIAGLVDPPLDEPWEALLLLDGRDVTDEAEVAAELFVFVPQDTLGAGGHRVTFSAMTATRVVEESWVFFAGSRDARESAPPAAEAVWEERPEVHGRLEVGWAAVAADLVETDTVSVALPHDEVSSPTLDFYASGYAPDLSFLLTAHYDPVYDERLQWLGSLETDRLELEAGRIFPSLSTMTLDWAVGAGARAAARLGASKTEVVALRLSEADTLAGLGLYSRFALGARQDVEVIDSVMASAIYLRVFDREGSVPEANRLEEPLLNTVVAGVVSVDAGAAGAELEVAGSTAEGAEQSSGEAVHARLLYEKDYDNRVILEYVYIDPDYYSAGSLEHDPGERGAELEFAYGPGDALRASGSVGAFRGVGSTVGVSPGGYALRSYGRLDGSWRLDDASLRAYAAGRYDRTPYESYDYVYTYASAGVTWRTSRLAASGSGSFSRSRSPGARDTWGVGGDLRYDLVPSRWRARLSARLTFGDDEEGDTDYIRGSYTIESTWAGGEAELTAEYSVIDLDDRVSPDQGYTEHVLRISVGRPF